MKKIFAITLAAACILSLSACGKAPEEKVNLTVVAAKMANQPAPPLELMQTDLEQAAPGVKRGDFVVINTGWHHKYSDALEYFGQAPGLTRDAAQWLIGKEVNLVAMDTPFIDHPLATDMGPHRGGPQMRRLAEDYRRATGKDPAVEHSEFFVAHKLLAGAGILTVLQVGGDVDDLNGQSAAFAATPWKFRKGDACQIRFVAMQDPAGTCRIDSGND